MLKLKNNLLVFLLIGLFMISFTSALDLDNLELERDTTFDGKQIKDYPLLQKYNPIEIVNWIGLGDTLFEGYLSQHNETCGIDCQSTLEINLHQDGVLVDDIYFKTLQEDGTWIKQSVRGSSFSYLGLIDDYETQCIDLKEIIDLNGTSYIPQKCSEVKIGSHEGQINYNIGEEVKAGIYTLTLDAQKKPSRTVDWIIKTNGEWLDGWATWGNISLGDDAEVILNSPADEEIDYDGNVVFNCSMNITGGATAVNISLWTNESGVWEIEETVEPLLKWNNGSSHTTNDPETVTNPGNAFDENDLTYAEKTTSGSTHLGKIFNSSFIRNIRINTTSKITSGQDHVTGVYLEIYNGSVWSAKATLDTGTTSAGYDGDYFLNDTTQGVRIRLYGFANPVSPAFSKKWYTLEYESNDSITSLTQTFTTTITTPTLWNVEACDSDGDCGFATSNYTVLLDAETPKINVTSPVGTLNYGAIGENETLNVTFTDTNLDSCWYNYNGTNVTIEGCLTGVSNATNFTLEADNLNMTIYANDSVGNLNSTFLDWNYKLLENSQTYSNSTTVGAVENFILNVTLGDGHELDSISFIYGNFTSSPSIASSGNNRIISVSNYEIPFYGVDTNVTFYWRIILDDSTAINTSDRTQLVTPILLDNCSVYTNQILNISLFDEETKLPINGNIELEYSLLNSQTHSTINTLYYTATGVNSTLICSEINISGEDLIYSTQIRYESTDYVSELYNIQRSAITSDAQSINLYDLNESDSTEFKVTYQDSTFNFVEGAIIQLQRKYISEGIYETVEAPLTSNEGIANLHIDTNSILYRATVVKNGVVLDEFDNLVFKCQSELVGECEQKLLGTIDPRNDVDLDTTRDFSYSIDREDNVITLAFTIPSGAPASVNMQLTQKDQFGSNEMCNETILSSAGSIQCTFNDTIGDSYIDLRIYKNVEPMAIQTYIIPEASGVDFLGNNYIIIVVLLLSVVGMALTSPEWIIINGIIVMVIAGALWLVNGLDFVMGLGSLMWLIIAAGILIFKLAKQEDR